MYFITHMIDTYKNIMNQNLKLILKSLHKMITKLILNNNIFNKTFQHPSIKP